MMIERLTFMRMEVSVSISVQYLWVAAKREELKIKAILSCVTVVLFCCILLL